MKPFLSVVIITKNEEINLPKLLASLGDIDKSIEVIVSDAFSRDNTRRIAKFYSCKIVDGGIYAVGRNNGFKAAEGEYVLFLDADVTLEKSFLNKLVAKIHKRNFDVASGFSIPDTDKPLEHLAVWYWNWWRFFTQKFNPGGYAHYMVVRKEHINKYGPFNEKLKVFEDGEFLKRMAKNGKFSFLRDPYMYCSSKRFSDDGHIKTFFRYICWPLYFRFFGEEGIENLFGEYKTDRD